MSGVETDRFVSVYNDTEKYPTLTDVALELGISYQTVRNKSCILRGQKRRGENVPELVSRVIVPKEKDPEAPLNHAAKRADLLRDDILRMITSSRYPVINPEAVTVDSYVSTKYDRLRGQHIPVEGTPRTWLNDTLRVEGLADVRARTFIFTAAQNEAEVDLAFWNNLKAYAEFRDADIVVGPGTYETQWWAENNPGVRSYAPEIKDYLCFGQMELGNFVFCGEMNMLPTANRPISDLTTYSRGKWAVFPHSKIQLKSVPSTDPNRQAHQVMTTGMVTKPKVIPRKAGIKSIFHHVIGAVIVEFDQDGDVFCRHLIADDDGSFYDLEFYVSNGVVGSNESIPLMVCGDVHLRKLDRVNALGTFGFYKNFGVNPISILDELPIERIAIHDVFDNESRNHHHIHDNAYSYDMAVRGRDDVFAEVEDVATFLELLTYKVPVTVVESNHDIALERYVREGRYRNDGKNIRFGLQLEDAYLAARERQGKAIDDGLTPERFSLLEHAIRKIADEKQFALDDVDWVHDGYSWVVDGIECGNHGFRGANGARGTVAGFAQLGCKMTIADKHSPEICDGVYVAGCMNLRQGYNKGPSGWAIAHVLQYANGKRVIVTMQKGKYRSRV